MGLLLNDGTDEQERLCTSKEARPFYRVDYARSPDTGGFGVRLAIAERAVRLHHGELSAVNRKGGGATIRITLPVIEKIK